MPLHIPLMTLVMLMLAASTWLALEHGTSPRTNHVAVADGGGAVRATPYGSSAALRNLLF